MDYSGFDAKHYDDFYLELRKKLRDWLQTDDGKSHKWAEFLMLAPDLFHLLIKLMLDTDVPAKEKAKILAVIIYFVSPLDLIPEGLVGPAGYLDDVALTALAVSSLVNNVDPKIVRRNWAGDGDILEVIKSILAAVDEMFGTGLWNMIKNMFPGG